MRAVKSRNAGGLRSVRDVGSNRDAAAAAVHAKEAGAAATLTVAVHHSDASGTHSEKGAPDDATLEVSVGTTGEKDKYPEDPLAVAFALDAPLTFTARDDPRVVARLPLRFKDVLPTVCHQLQFRQRQATHQTSVDADSYTTKSNPLSSPVPPTADATSYAQPPYQHAHLSDMVMRLLPVAHLHQQQLAASAKARAGHEAEDAVLCAPARVPVLEDQLYRTWAADQILDYLFSPTSADGAGSVDRDEVRRSFTVAACLSGMREVPADTVEYVELLRRMLSLADSRRGAEPNNDADDADVDLPAYVRDVLVGVLPTENAPAAAANTASAVERVPVVTTTLRSTLDATHPDDVSVLEEIETLREALASEYTEVPVGAVLVILERTSDVQAPRDYLVKLERTLDEVLEKVKARCCGRPLQLIRTSTAHPSCSRQQHTASAPAASAKGREGAAAAAILATPDKWVCTHTLKPLPVQPVATSASGGGSATVAATLNVLELNKERTLVQLSLLGEELLRQVTVDLPERGILLRRLLDEAQLSIDARAILARERCNATQAHLLDGQDTREATAAQCKVLESEVAELRSRLASVTARKAALGAWVEEQKARELTASRERALFEHNLRERLVAHTERVKAAQDAERRSSLPG
ncbi:Axonemal dynein light chain family protein [Leishmania donovani]|uniref:Axonemal dynein light chain family protein n=1 Tax=Leishmania donovani TaxID=5661 RepID=A0A504XV46_LEIDO|nr:Axonemal dynein light chain family protein [Leishmania donovani]